MKGCFHSDLTHTALAWDPFSEPVEISLSHILYCCVAHFNFSTSVFSLGIRFSLPYSPRYTEVVTSLLALTYLFSQCVSPRCALWKCKGSRSCAIFPHVVIQVYCLGPKHESVYADKMCNPARTSLCSYSPFTIS